MVIQPLPVFEADADPHHRSALTDAEMYERLEAPKTIVVKFGSMKMIGEFPYDGEAKPGCGSKLVIRSHRGTELAEMLTTTCENAGCSKSVTRKEMLEYIDNSGGKDYPFHTNGKILRIATIEDINKHSQLQTNKSEYISTCKDLIVRHELDMKLVDVELILGDELLTFFYMSEDRVDFRSLVRELASAFKTRIDLRQVGARDEARLVADYERCGQHCCCKNFLKVLKPISMRSAKMQKATLDPLKISGRCGRLMCCLRYEDETYKDLKKNLPHRKTRVGTAEGPGYVVDSKILTQLVLVKLEHNNEEMAFPVEELMDPENCPSPGETQRLREKAAAEAAAAEDPLRGLAPAEVEKRTDDKKRSGRGRGRDRDRGRGRDSGGRGRTRSKEQQQDAYREAAETGDRPPAPAGEGKKKKRRRGRRRPSEGKGQTEAKAQGSTPQNSPSSGDEGGNKPRRKRRRRNRGKKPGGGDNSGGNSGGDSGGGG